MKAHTVVDIPYAKKLSYTLFAQGFTVGIPRVDTGADYVHFTFYGGSVFLLFYTFREKGRRDYRRAYITQRWKDGYEGESAVLPGVHDRVRIIYTARGRKVDHLKRCAFLLTKDEPYRVFRFPPLFWYKLAYLIQYCGACKSDVLLLHDTFKKSSSRRQ